MPGLLGTLVEGISAFLNQGLYKSSSLEEALREAFPPQPLFGGISKFNSPSVKTAVTTSTRRGQVIVLANYNRSPPERGKTGYEALVLGTFYELQISGSGREMQLWEAARATSAAPLYFPPFSREGNHDATRDGTKQVYLDGGLWHNNPIRIADSEARAIWPNDKHAHPDMILSIGTGYHKSELNASNGTQVFLDQVINESVPEATGSPKSRSFIYNIAETGVSQFMRSLNSERIWHEWLQTRAPGDGFESRYRRLNVEFDQIISMDDASDKAIKACRDSVNGIPESTFESVADQLIASCFFFRADKGSIHGDPKWSYECSEIFLKMRDTQKAGFHISGFPRRIKDDEDDGKSPFVDQLWLEWLLT
ncbi:hypothetical protein NW755_009847 [Fusarium falciforme]|uniref:PNPLA domain-containing protein n=1 Tax=Fusarium falciforme TaxID=195108 RepID=A0A9W8QZJ7_9HYPO|nr:hypothetical protein NW755_009847 [Fusarium falciforme]